MFGSFASSRLALTLRRLRGRFGISAPRVAVRTHLPGYWRALSVILLSAGASLLGAGAHLVAVDALRRLGLPAPGLDRAG